MTCQFALSLRKSKVLNQLSQQVFSESIFDVNAGLQEILSIKCLKNKESLTVNNISLCLDHLHELNVLYIYIDNLKSEHFDYSNDNHCKLLDKVNIFSRHKFMSKLYLILFLCNIF